MKSLIFIVILVFLLMNYTQKEEKQESITQNLKQTLMKQSITPAKIFRYTT